MSDLERFRDHCRAMAGGQHTPECVAVHDREKSRWSHFFLFREWPEKWGPRPSGPPQPCPGDCVPDADKALFTRLADEVDAYLSHDDSPLWEDA